MELEIEIEIEMLKEMGKDVRDRKERQKRGACV